MEDSKINDLYSDFLSDKNEKDMRIVLNNIRDIQLKELFDYSRLKGELDKLMEGLSLLEENKITNFFMELKQYNDRSNLNLILEQLGQIPNFYSTDILLYSIENFSSNY